MKEKSRNNRRNIVQYEQLHLYNNNFIIKNVNYSKFNETLKLTHES